MAKLDPVSLRLFITVIESNSIAAAASTHHIAATAVSKRISDLEEIFGTTLLQRTNRGVNPTEAGLALLSFARRALNELDSIKIAMQDYSEGGVGQVTLCVSTSAMPQFLSQDLADFLVSNPGVKLSVDEKPSEEAIRLLDENAVQIAIYANVSEVHGQTILPYRKDRLVVVYHPDHPLAMQPSVGFQETLAYDYVGWFSGSAIHKQLEMAARMSYCNWQVRARVNSFDALARMVSSRIGIGVLPEGVAKQKRKIFPLGYSQLTDAWAIRQFYIAVRSCAALPEPAMRLQSYLLDVAAKSDT